jgi:serpin B
MSLKQKRWLCALLTLTALLALGTYLLQSPSVAPKPRFTTPQPVGDAAKAAQANNTFAWALWSKLAPDQASGKNIFFSPTSISQALSLAATGAQSPTADELWSTLGFSLATDNAADQAALTWSLDQAQANGVQLAIANALWATAADPLKSSFISQAKSLFAASAQNLDFNDPSGSASTINAWIADNTANKIQNLIPPSAINKDTRLILTNAVYFKADWDEPFKTDHTRSAPFKIPGKDPVTVDMMNAEIHGVWSEDDAFKMIQLPYKGNRLTFRAILAKEGATAPLDADRLAALLKKTEHTLFFVGLPKFKLQYEQELTKPLQSLGIKQAFIDGDFTPTFQNKHPSGQPTVISDVWHKTFIQIDEKGTEATAASLLMTKAGAAPGYTFYADHPFIFQIVDTQTGAILFMGQVNDPSK